MDERDEGFGLNDIWVSYRADVNDDLGWEIPENLGPNINTPLHDGDPYIVYAPTGNILFFTRLDDPAGAGDWDIFQSFQQPDGSWGPASPVDSLNTPYRETKPWLCPDGLEIFFTSTRPGGFGQKDIWTSTRPSLDDDWSTPINLGSGINTVGDENQSPSISWDCTTMYFQSNRPGTLGLHDIYMSSRRPL